MVSRGMKSKYLALLLAFPLALVVTNWATLPGGTARLMSSYISLSTHYERPVLINTRGDDRDGKISSFALCFRLHRERELLQQEILNVKHENRRGMATTGIKNVAIEVGRLESKLNSTDQKIETLRNCSYQQLMSHRLADGRLINDPTLPWNATMHRPWLDASIPLADRPPAMLLLTTLGWNARNATAGLKYWRHKFETGFYSALVNHPWFHPTGWDDIESGRLGVRRRGVNYYVFADLCQYYDPNYPVYGGGRGVNMDSSFGREDGGRAVLGLDTCGRDRGITKARLFRELYGGVATQDDGGYGGGATQDDGGSDSSAPPSTAKLVMFTRRGHSVLNVGDSCKQKAMGLPVVSVSLDGRWPYVNGERGDQGMVPPLLTAVKLNAGEENDIQTCLAETNRRFHVSYVGNFRSGPEGTGRKGFRARSAYKGLHDNNRTVVVRYFYGGEVRRSAIANMTYREVMRGTEFALAPRGDNKYSYRLSEVLSAGAIPVVHADDYVFPLRPEVVEWDRCAVVLPENRAGRFALDRIANMTPGERCDRRRYCYFHIYKRYVETPAKQLDGYIEGLEAAARGNATASFAGLRCNASSIASWECNPD